MWRPSAAHVRAAFVGLALAAAAVIWRRPDLLVLATPLAVVAAWSAATRPTTAPIIHQHLADATIREGEATAWTATVRPVDGMDFVAAVVAPGPWTTLKPAGGSVAGSATDGAELGVAVRSTRWGRHPVGPMRIVASSAWGAFQWTADVPQHTITTLPLPTDFDSNASLRRSNGLVGLHRSARPGDGSEFASIRPFQVGDRIRRIHWPRSMRTGSLHVTSTWAEQDNHIVLVIDATEDLGVSEGIDGTPSSLDITVRAAGAIAAHHIQRGDRVSLRVFGATNSPSVPAATGNAHLRRLLDTLTTIRPGGDPMGLGARGRMALPADALAFLLSPLVSTVALERAVSMARHGVSVVVVDTLPTTVVTDPDPVTALAWRIRLLERRREVRVVQEVGIAVVRWDGPASLDHFLRDVARRASAPRMRVR